MFEGDVARREDLSWQQLPPHVLLTELLRIGTGQENSIQKSGHLDVVSEGQDGEVAGKDDVVAVDPGRVLLVEAAQAVHLDGCAELNAGNLEGARRAKHWQRPEGRQQETKSPYGCFPVHGEAGHQTHFLQVFAGSQQQISFSLTENTLFGSDLKDDIFWLDPPHLLLTASERKKVSETHHTKPKTKSASTAFCS